LKRPGIAHSEYLQYGAEIGLPATLLLFTLAGYLVFLAVRRSRTCAVEMRFIQEAAILVAAGLAAHALIDNNWTIPVMAAGLVVFSLADCLPMRPWNYGFYLPTRTVTAGALMIGIGLYLHSTLIPAVGLYFNEAGHNAYEKRDLTTAESAHRIAVSIVPDQTVFLDNTGLLYLEMYSMSRDKKFLDLAEFYLVRAMQSNLNADDPRRHMETLLINRLTGREKADLRTHRRIAEADRELLRVDPFNPFVRKNLAEALHTAGLRDEAERELILSTEVEPNYVPAYLRLADWSDEKGNTDEAAVYRKKATSVAETYQHVSLIEPYELMLLGRSDAQLNNGQALRQ
jgi:tetratricopeptide (TPR) repeat protein